MTDPASTAALIAARHTGLDDRCKKHLITAEQQEMIDLLRESVNACYCRDCYGLLYPRPGLTLPTAAHERN